MAAFVGIRERQKLRQSLAAQKSAGIRSKVMRASVLNRKLHRWGAILTALPLLVVVVTGIILQFKKQSDWVQPPTQKGSTQIPRGDFSAILETASRAKNAGINSWEDIDRLDVRPAKGIVKVRAKNQWEVQIDLANHEILQESYRRSDFIESLHDGSFFGLKMTIFLASGLVLLLLWGSGLYLFFLPYLAKRNRRRAQAKS